MIRPLIGTAGASSRSVDSFNRFISSLGLVQPKVNSDDIAATIENMDDTSTHTPDPAPLTTEEPMMAPVCENTSASEAAGSITSGCESSSTPESVTMVTPTPILQIEHTTTTTAAETGKRKFITSEIGEITISEPGEPPLKIPKVDDPFAELLPPPAPPVFDKPITRGVSIMDVAKLEYAAKQLQKNLKLITKQAPDIYQLKLVVDSLDSGAAIEFQHNELITMAARIKSRYKIGKLPIFDEIISGKIGMTETDMESLKQLQEENLVCEVPPIINTAQADGVDSSELPPLPPIRDPVLEARVFTHRSYMNNRSSTSEETTINGHNERLEFLGDSILNTLVTIIIYNMFTTASEGQLSKIRSDLVNNKTLGHFSLAYGMDKRLKTSIVDLAVTPDQKLFADVFEAYIGALAVEHDLDLEDIRQWLDQLYTPMLNNLRDTYIKPPIDREAKTQLYSMIGTNESHPQYRTIQQGNPVTGMDFVVNCTMEGELLGSGSGNSIKEASLRAAMDALSHEEKLEKYYLHRQEIELPIRKRRNELKELKREEKLKQIQQELAEAAKLPPLPPPSPIRTSCFPLEPDYSLPLDHEAKNELYALIGKKARVQPTYIVSKTSDNKHIVTLKIRGVTIVSAEDSSKKKAMSRAARTLLNHKEAMYEISKSF